MKVYLEAKPEPKSTVDACAIHAALDKFMLHKTESMNAKPFRISDIHTRNMMAPGRKATTYYFKHPTGEGSVQITHSGTTVQDPESHISFDVEHYGTAKPDHRNAARILRTVEKAVRHHMMTMKPNRVGYYAMTDIHDDKSGKDVGRRFNIYKHMASRIFKNWKIDKENSSGNRVQMVRQ